jgi:cytochrome c peroxidase
MFEQAFGAPVSAKNLAWALASYERSLLTGNSRFDRYLYGDDRQALSEQERQGFEIFIGNGSCTTCHDIFHPEVNELGGAIATFTDQRYHNLGIGYADGRMTDLGRYERTRDRADWGSFRTPTLRNVALTAPYMHDGSLGTLEEVVNFYNRGGESNPNISPGLHPLFLTPAEKRALVAFLKTLTDPDIEKLAETGNKAETGPGKVAHAGAKRN